jgi:hypothetical protein
MNKKILRYQLNALLENSPDFNFYTEDSETHLRWMNSVYTVIYQWKPFPAIAIASAIEFMPVKAERPKNIETIFNVAHHAIAELQFEIDASSNHESSASAQSMIDKDRASLIATANDRIFIVDHSCDADKLHFFSQTLQETVQLRLLVKECSSDVSRELEKINSQSDSLIQIKIDSQATETLFFIDDLNAWASVGDGYQADPLLSDTITPLKVEQVSAKRTHYETVWAEAKLV